LKKDILVVTGGAGLNLPISAASFYVLYFLVSDSLSLAAFSPSLAAQLHSPESATPLSWPIHSSVTINMIRA
jgi:hypothetical protein